VKDIEKDGFSTQLYISAQAPLPSTFSDFWRMIWEYNVPAVLMLTNLVEDSNIKAEVYWPSAGKAIRFRGNTVLCKKEEVKSSSMIIRYFCIWSTPMEEKKNQKEQKEQKNNNGNKNGKKIEMILEVMILIWLILIQILQTSMRNLLKK